LPLREAPREAILHTARFAFWHNHYGMTSWTFSALLRFCLFLVGSVVLAQGQAPPVITFTLDFPGSSPERYVFEIPSKGKASYDSRGPLDPESEARDDFHLDFDITDATRTRIFELAGKTHNFSGDLDSHRKNLASTGSKTLTYSDGTKQTSATYNYSQQAPVQDLTRLFQDMSSTLEFARRLDFFHRYQKLALDAELKRMEQMAKGNGLVELQAAEPILRQIADDPAVINVVRARARSLTERQTR
jgi:hypothetical protein